MADTDTSDEEFFQDFYSRYRRLMLSRALQPGDTVEDAEDIVCEALEKLVSKVDTIRNLSNYALMSYVISTVENTAKNYRKHIKKHKLYDIPYDPALHDEKSTSSERFVEHEAIQNIHRNDIIKAIDKLPDEEKMLLKGKYLFNLSDKDLATIFDCKASSIRMKITRAKRHALELIKKEGLYNDTP